MQIARSGPEGSGWLCRYLGEVPEGSGADVEVGSGAAVRSGSGRFRCR